MSTFWHSTTGCEFCAGSIIDPEHVAAGIASAHGKPWHLLNRAERDEYLLLAEGALEAVGFARGSGIEL